MTEMRQQALELGDDPLKLDRQICFALAVASRTVIAIYRPLLEPLNLTHPQYLVMLALWERSPRSVKSITDDIKLDSATLSPLLKRLEACGYISRTRNPDDERALCLELTETGRELRARALAVPYAVVDQLGLDVTELLDIRARLLTLIDAAVKAAERGAEPKHAQ